MDFELIGERVGGKKGERKRGSGGEGRKELDVVERGEGEVCDLHGGLGAIVLSDGLNSLRTLNGGSHWRNDQPQYVE